MTDPNSSEINPKFQVDLNWFLIFISGLIYPIQVGENRKVILRYSPSAAPLALWSKLEIQLIPSNRDQINAIWSGPGAFYLLITNENELFWPRWKEIVTLPKAVRSGIGSAKHPLGIWRGLRITQLRSYWKIFELSISIIAALPNPQTLASKKKLKSFSFIAGAQPFRAIDTQLYQTWELWMGSFF